MKVVCSLDLRVHSCPIEGNAKLGLWISRHLVLMAVGVAHRPDGHVVHVHVGLDHVAKVGLLSTALRVGWLRAVKEVAVVHLSK